MEWLLEKKGLKEVGELQEYFEGVWHAHGPFLHCPSVPEAHTPSNNDPETHRLQLRHTKIITYQLLLDRDGRAHCELWRWVESVCKGGGGEDVGCSVRYMYKSYITLPHC